MSLLLNSKLYKGAAYTFGLGSLGFGSATAKAYMNESSRWQFLNMIEAMKNNEITLKDLWQQENDGKNLILEEDKETWRLVSWLNAPRINEIAEKIVIKKVPYFWFNQREFQRVGYKLVSWDFSELIKDYCSKHLSIRFSRDLINHDYVKVLKNKITSWCSIPKGYDTTRKLLKNVYDDFKGRDTHMGFFIHDVDSILKEKQLYYKHNVDVSGWLWSNWPISNVLDFCTTHLRKNSITNIPEADLERMCIRKGRHFAQMPKLSMKRWKLRDDREEKIRINESLDIIFEN